MMLSSKDNATLYYLLECNVFVQQMQTCSVTSDSSSSGMTAWVATQLAEHDHQSN